MRFFAVITVSPAGCYIIFAKILAYLLILGMNYAHIGFQKKEYIMKGNRI